MRFVLVSLIGLSLTGCFSSHGDDDSSETPRTRVDAGISVQDSSVTPPDRCQMTKECFAVDSLGCCDDDATAVSVCDPCPSGTIERRGCRMNGCDNPCNETSGAGAQPPDPGDDRDLAPRPAVLCFQNAGDGCCGDQVFNADMCGRCPPGSVSIDQCGGFYPECGTCLDGPDDGGGANAPVPPPQDGGEPDIGSCFTNLGGGCCGDYAGEPGVCGCPPGTLYVTECATFPNGGDPINPPGPCRQDYGGGCCGAQVARNACGTCPPGTVEDWTCQAILSGTNGFDGGSGPPSGANERPSGADEAPPGLIATRCRSVMPGTDCCGDYVPVNACGECPAGSIPEWDCGGNDPTCVP